MKTSYVTTMFAILATMLFAACGEEASTETTAETAPAAEEATAEEAPAAEQAAAEEAEPANEAAPAAGGGSACDRAQSCCEAYVNEMAAMAGGAAALNAETTCAGVAAARNTPAADSACEQMITGWRTGLETAQRTVPSACAAQ